MKPTNETNPDPDGSAIPCFEIAAKFVTELGRIYLEAGLPLAAACEAALADSLFFEYCEGGK